MPTISFDLLALKTLAFEAMDGGEKYVAVAAGGKSLWRFRQGAVVVFRLD
jgi:hypothetical protein